MEVTVFDRTKTGLRTVFTTAFWGDFRQLCSCYCKVKMNFCNNQAKSATFIIKPLSSHFYFATQIIDNWILHMIPRLCGISLSSVARLRSWKPSDSNIQELIRSVDMTAPTLWYFLNPERRHCQKWQWQPFIIDNDLSMNEMYTHAQSEPFFNNGCFTDVFLKRAKWTWNVCNALAVVHRVWCLSFSPNGQPWTKWGPLGHEMRPLENKIIKKQTA